MNLAEKYLVNKGTTTINVDIPEWGDVKIRSLSLSEMDRLEKKIQNNPSEALALAVLLGVSDENGKRVFTDNNLDDIKATSFQVVKSVAESVIKHNSLTAEVVEDAKKN